MWGDTRISPASLIFVTNMVKSVDSNDVTRHPTSGSYLILKQIDKVSNDSFTQQLSLIRTNASIYSNINPQNIDFSKGVERLNEKTNAQLEIEHKAQATVEESMANKEINNLTISLYVSLWDEYLNAIKRKNPMWVYWGTTAVPSTPTIANDVLYLNFNTYWTTSPSISGYTNSVYAKKAGAESAWYTTDTSNVALLNGPIIIDPIVKAWYEKALQYKSAGTLGTVMLHHPQHLTPSGEKQRNMSFDI
jgi:hypothetical protein